MVSMMMSSRSPREGMSPPKKTKREGGSGAAGRADVVDVELLAERFVRHDRALAREAHERQLAQLRQLRGRQRRERVALGPTRFRRITSRARARARAKTSAFRAARRAGSPSTSRRRRSRAARGAAPRSGRRIRGGPRTPGNRIRDAGPDVLRVAQRLNARHGQQLAEDVDAFRVERLLDDALGRPPPRALRQEAELFERLGSLVRCAGESRHPVRGLGLIAAAPPSPWCRR